MTNQVEPLLERMEAFVERTKNMPPESVVKKETLSEVLELIGEILTLHKKGFSEMNQRIFEIREALKDKVSRADWISGTGRTLGNPMIGGAKRGDWGAHD